MKHLDIFSNKVGICNRWLDSLLQVIACFLKRIPLPQEGTKFADYSKLSSVFAFLLFLRFCKNVQIAPVLEMLEIDCGSAGAPRASRSSSSLLDVQGTVSSPLVITHTRTPTTERLLEGKELKGTIMQPLCPSST